MLVPGQIWAAFSEVVKRQPDYQDGSVPPTWSCANVFAIKLALTSMIVCREQNSGELINDFCRQVWRLCLGQAW